MTGYFNALTKLLADSTDIKDPSLVSAISKMLSHLRSQQELRFFVDGTPNCGHQAATVHLIKRLVDLSSYTGRITVVYADIHRGSFGSTADKLALLLPGLDPAKIDTATLAYGGCKDIRFLNYNSKHALVDEAYFGFTAAADDMRINFAIELNVKLFLRLQPYQWEDHNSKKSDQFYVTSRVETSTGRCFCLAEENPPFRNMPYKFSVAVQNSVDDGVWDWYGNQQTFDLDLRLRTRIARILYNAKCRNARLSLWPIYGLHHFKNSLVEVGMNLLLAGLHVQQSTPGPVVMVLINHASDLAGLGELISPFAHDMASGNYRLENFKAALAARHQSRSDESPCNGALDAFTVEIANRLREWMDCRGRIVLLSGHGGKSRESIDLSDVLEEALSTASDYDFLVVNTGPLPGDIYNYFYAHCEMPGVFEGKHTCSLSISLGRPFLLMPRENAAEEEPYPEAIAGRKFVKIAKRASAAAISLRFQRYEPYLRRSCPLAPAEYLNALGKTADFILSTRNEKSEVASYFRSLGGYFQEDIHDKSVLGLIALALTANS